MSKPSSLEPVEQRQVIFYDDELTAIRASDGEIYVSLRQICHALGIDTQAQRRRIERTTILADGLKGVANLATPGGSQFGYVLQADLIPLWLSGIRTKAVSEDVRPKLERFQRRAARVLWEAFQRGELTADEEMDALLTSDDPLAVAYRHGMAIANLAREQLALKAQFNSRMSSAEIRLDAIEAELGNTSRFITVSQAAELSDAVRAIGLIFSKATGAIEYGKVYGELYRRYGINSYKRLPAAKFDEAIDWLRQWYEELADTDTTLF